MPGSVDGTSRVTDLYLDLLKACLTRSWMEERYRPIPPGRGVRRAVLSAAQRVLGIRGLELVHQYQPGEQVPEEGSLTQPPTAETMIGRKRLDNIQFCVDDVIEGGVPGDLLEAGVWRGGAVIFMRALLEARGDQHRLVWAADSFEGLPRPSDEYQADAGDNHWKASQLAVSLPEVQANFRRYGLLDDRVRFLQGWFKDTLPTAPVDRLAVLRLDGDMYQSTMDVLTSLYPKLSPGGYLIVDDYGAIEQCRKAVHDYRDDHGITEAIEPVDWTGVYWRRSSS